MKAPAAEQSNIWINMLSIFIITVALLFFFVFRRPRAACNSPPSPPKLPIIGNLHQLGSFPQRSLQALSRKYGPLMLLYLGQVPTIVVSSAEMACEVMKTHDLHFASRPRSSMTKMLAYDSDIAFAPYGEYWRKVRKICILHLLSNKMVQSYRSTREEEVSLMISKIRTSPDQVNLSGLIYRLTYDIICKVALGRKYCEEGGDKVQEMLGEFLYLMGSFPVGDLVPWLAWVDHVSGLNSRAKKNAKQLDSFLHKVLEEHIRAKRDAGNNYKKAGDLVDVLLSLDEKDASVGICLTRDNIKAIILDMFSGGTDTAFLSLVWAMVELIRNPKVMKMLQEEVRGVVGRNHEITDKDLDKMNYLKAVIKETLRLHTPIPLLVPRESIQDANLGGFHIPMGTRVLVNAWAIGRDPRWWDKPEEFAPERFIDSNVDFKGHDFQFTPFGAGRRSCPGVGFAISTIELTLAHLLLHFDWELPKGMEREALDMSESPGAMLYKKSALILTAKPWVA